MKIFCQFNRKFHLLGQAFLFVLIINNSIYACTIFNKTKGDTVLVGNNEDWLQTDSQVMFYPASEGKYGRMYFGFNNNGFGGMNECGLFFDVCALPRREIKFPEDKPLYLDDFWEFALETCATVDEVVHLVNQYYIECLNRQHVMFVDSTGNSAVIEWAQDSLAIIYKTGDYQLITNFMISDTNLARSPPCWRYNTANQMLQDCDVSIESFGHILAAVHQEGNFATQYSNVYDLKNRVVYVVHYHNYNEVIMFDLIEELKQGYHIYELPTLFTNAEPIHNESKTPTHFQLLQNYPNPFNPSTTIRYNLKESSDVMLKIYNLAGQELVTLENGFKTAGEHDINWTPDGLPSGIYFCRLQAGDPSASSGQRLLETKKFILQK